MSFDWASKQAKIRTKRVEGNKKRSAFGESEGGLIGCESTHDTEKKAKGRKSYKTLPKRKREKQAQASSRCRVRGKFIKCLRSRGCLTRLLRGDSLLTFIFPDTISFACLSCVARVRGKEATWNDYGKPAKHDEGMEDRIICVAFVILRGFFLTHCPSLMEPIQAHSNVKNVNELFIDPFVVGYFD